VTLHVALIGFGLGGEAFHAPLIACTPGLRLASIVTSDGGRRARAQKLYPDAHLAASSEEVWARAREHDLVVITTANRAHVPLALAALGAGLPVVIDKPFAPTVVDARRVIDEARRRGLLAVPYHERRWDSELLTVKRLLNEGAFGQVLRFESRLERWRPEAKGGWRELGAPEEAGGLLYDLGTHLIDQALHLFGPVTHVYAELDRRRPGIQVDDDVFLALTHASGVRSRLTATLLAAVPIARIGVFGSRAGYVKRHADLQESALREGRRPDEPGWGEDPQDRWGVLGAGEETRPVPSEAGRYQAFYAGMVAALRDGAPPPVDPEDAVKGLEIVEAAQRSARAHEVVKL
jgi:predicted dehydrogenase